MAKASTAQKPARKTMDVTLGPDAWGPIVKWVRDHQELNGLFGMYIDMEAVPGIVAMLVHAKKLTHTQDMKLRLHHHKMDALHEQLRFWESCMVELSPKLQESAPPFGVFQEAALEIEGAWIDAKAAMRRTTSATAQSPTCNKCGQPVERAGRATVDLDSQSRITTVYTHLDC